MWTFSIQIHCYAIIISILPINRYFCRSSLTLISISAKTHNKRQVIFRDLGAVDYKSAWELQDKLFSESISIKLAARNAANHSFLPANHLLFCEHPPVYTIGKSGTEKNMLISPGQLKEQNITLFHIDRGGDITFHGPGQIVGYPIIDLEAFGLSLKDYICLLEETIIQVLSEYKIHAGRLKEATGVWLEPEGPRARKICAIGVRASRFITMHGFAFNVNTDLKYFSYINPCGFTDKAVTSLQKETGKEQNITTVKDKLLNKIAELFGMELLYL
jgi:lipoyl(octanoyl) transferase